MFDKLKQGLKGIVDKISKTGLTEKDLEPLIWDLQMQLIANDVSVQVAERVCEELKKRLVGTEANRFGGKGDVVKNALKESIEAVLHADKAVDLLAAVADAKKAGHPYVVIFVGVGQSYDDLQPFDAGWFADKLLGDS